MKLITFATYEEAEATLLNLKSETVHVAITGIGSFAAYTALLGLIKEYDHIINIGLAGALKPNLPLGSIHPVATVGKYAWHPKGPEKRFEDISLQKDGLHLLTFDFPVNEKKEYEADLVDMEGYGIALAAKNYGKKCELYKLVSDHCTNESGSQIANNIKRYSQLISDYIKDMV